MIIKIYTRKPPKLSQSCFVLSVAKLEKHTEKKLKKIRNYGRQWFWIYHWITDKYRQCEFSPIPPPKVCVLCVVQNVCHKKIYRWKLSMILKNNRTACMWIDFFCQNQNVPSLIPIIRTHTTNIASQLFVDFSPESRHTLISRAYQLFSLSH